MSSNQTIDGVPVFYAIDPLDAYPEPVGTDDKIERSNGALWVHLNGKRSKLIGLQSLDFLINQLVQIKGEVFGTEPAAQPQGEPVAHLLLGETFYGTNGPEIGDFDIQYDHKACERLSKALPGQQVALYAEQPAPVAVVLPERREIGPNHPYLSDLDIEWNACLDEVTRLNTK